jgi:hypothetical protein
MTALAPTLQAVFTDRLAQRDASAHTVAAYRDALRMLIVFAADRLATEPSRLDLADLDAPMTPISARLFCVGRDRRFAHRAVGVSAGCGPGCPSSSWRAARSSRRAPSPPGCARAGSTSGRRLLDLGAGDRTLPLPAAAGRDGVRSPWRGPPRRSGCSVSTPGLRFARSSATTPPLRADRGTGARPAAQHHDRMIEVSSGDVVGAG